MNDFVTSIAADFSENAFPQLGVHEPIDAYIDPIVNIFGESPTQEEAIAVYKHRISDLTAELSEWMEMDLEEDFVRQWTYVALVNYFGEIIDEP